MIHWILAIRSLVPLPFLKPAWTSGSSPFTYCWSLAWRILSITLLVCEMSTIVWFLSILWHCLSLRLEWKLTFSSPVRVLQSIEPSSLCYIVGPCWLSILNTVVRTHQPQEYNESDMGDVTELSGTGLEKVSFHSNPKERQCQRIFKLPHNCSHFTC